MQYRPRALYLHSPAFLTPVITDTEGSFLAKWLPKHNPPEMLFHYTDLSGMQGILNDRSLWLGHASCFSDPSEIQYGKGIVSSILLNEVEKEGNEGIRMFLRMMLNHIQAFAASSTHDVFVSCFCESGNLLDQWLKYARGGEGYSLGFKFSSTTRIASDSQKLEAGKEPYFRKVVYNEECQRILVQEYLGSILNAIKEGLKTGDVEFSEKDGNSAVVATQAADILLDMMVCFKHPAFEPENEWRLIRITRHDVEPEALRFRESSGELKPYRPMYIYDVEENEELSFPLRSIGFGPKLEPGRTHPTIRLLIQHLAADQHLIKVPTHNIQVYAAGYPLRKE